MKKLFIPVIGVFLTQVAFGGDDTVVISGGTSTTTTTSIGVLRGGGNLYRPIPRGVAHDLSTSERYRAVVYRPTQHFYGKDSVISYRYAAAELSRLRSVYGGTYLGPHGAQFIPSEHATGPNATVRSYAAVNKRLQPGVAMVPKTTRVRVSAAAEEVRSPAVSRLQYAKAE